MTGVDALDVSSSNTSAAANNNNNCNNNKITCNINNRNNSDSTIPEPVKIVYFLGKSVTPILKVADIGYVRFPF